MTIAEYMNNWMNEITKDMVVKYDVLGFRASGQWEKELSTSLDANQFHYHGEIKGMNYTYWMEHGRKAGKFPPINAIKKWIDDKNISYEGITKNSLAFLIARKIANEGTTVRPGIVSDAITEQRINELIKNVGRIFTTQVQSDVINTFK